MEPKNITPLEEVKRRLKMQAEQNFKKLMVQYQQDQELIYQLVAVNQVLVEKRTRLLRRVKLLKSKLRARARRKKLKEILEPPVKVQKENHLLLDFKRRLNASLEGAFDKEQKPTLLPPKPKR